MFSPRERKSGSKRWGGHRSVPALYRENTSLRRLSLACGMLRPLEISNARRVVAPAEEAYGYAPGE
jgi:hypothetical protein